ncbi:MAG TPA: hypothetical protein VND68_12990 [Chloroflexia bacterium]|jgi:phage baseplate assembly protein W|nr:hypothetical protein [Chloroflexia bacterium]
MDQSHAHFGTDLRLLRDLERQNDRAPGNDLAITRKPQPEPQPDRVDLETLSGDDNLKQALLLRFLTPVGQLKVLGHPEYGSHLFELIGELNNETNRNRAKMFVLQALAGEPRVKRVRSVLVTQNRAYRERMDIEASLEVIGSDTVLNLVFPFFLDGDIRT